MAKGVINNYFAIDNYAYIIHFLEKVAFLNSILKALTKMSFPKNKGSSIIYLVTGQIPNTRNLERN